MLKTIGISPKVKFPALALAALGVVVVIAGVVLGLQPVASAGAALVAASGISFGIGYSAPPGQLGLTHAVQPIDPAQVLKVLETAKADIEAAATPAPAAAAVTTPPA